MKIVLCIKQVPDTADIKWTENNTLQREGVESVINPYDMYAIETALRIKDEQAENVNITVITMGPNQAFEALRKALAMGCDDAFLLSDKKFAGADTVATSRTLAAAIKTFVPDFDLIICGQFATDGDTAQTGPSIAQHLGITQVTYVNKIQSIGKENIILRREIEDGIEVVRAKLPTLVCMLKCEYEPREVFIEGYMKAQDYDLKVYGFEDIGLQQQDVGMKGSPTYVSKAFRPEPKQNGTIVQKASAEEYVTFLDDKVKELMQR